MLASQHVYLFNIEICAGIAIYSSCRGVFGADCRDRAFHDRPHRIAVCHRMVHIAFIGAAFAVMDAYFLHELIFASTIITTIIITGF